MASVGIGFDGNRICRLSENNPYKNVQLGGPCNVKACNDLLNASRFKKGRVVSMSMNTSSSGSTTASSRLVKKADPFDGNQKAAVVHEKIDQWMRDSVAEIVKNLRGAPLLVHVYAEGSGEMTTLNTEKSVVEEQWPDTMKRWVKRETQLPDGVIFVEKLEDQEDDDGGDGGAREAEEDVTRAWGLVVQGRGADCGPICYLLKTSRVGSGPGLGLSCTHFCLMRVKSFEETARSQLKNCWLLQGQ